MRACRRPPSFSTPLLFLFSFSLPVCLPLSLLLCPRLRLSCITASLGERAATRGGCVAAEERRGSTLGPTLALPQLYEDRRPAVTLVTPLSPRRLRRASRAPPACARSTALCRCGRMASVSSSPAHLTRALYACGPVCPCSMSMCMGSVYSFSRVWPVAYVVVWRRTAGKSGNR